MARLDHIKPKVGACYLVTLSTGIQRRYRFEGLGQHMAPQWRDMETNDLVVSVPAATNSIEINCK